MSLVLAVAESEHASLSFNAATPFRDTPIKTFPSPIEKWVLRLDKVPWLCAKKKKKKKTWLWGLGQKLSEWFGSIKIPFNLMRSVFYSLAVLLGVIIKFQSNPFTTNIEQDSFFCLTSKAFDMKGYVNTRVLSLYFLPVSIRLWTYPSESSTEWINHYLNTQNSKSQLTRGPCWLTAACQCQ